MIAPTAGSTGAACVVPGCSVPYLTVRELGPDEALTLCLGHAEQAAAAPDERLRHLAGTPRRHASRPPWRTRPLLARVGGNFYYETRVLFRLGAVTCVGFDRDDGGNLLLDLRMPTASGQPRARISGNLWKVLPDGAEVACPASGRLLDISYPDGDRFRAEFSDVHDVRALRARFGGVARWAYRIRFPVTLVELSLRVANTDLGFDPEGTEMGGPSTVDCFTSHGIAAIGINLTKDQLDGLFP